MGIRMTGLASGIDPKLVDQLVEVQKLPMEAAQKRKEKVVQEKGEFSNLDKLLSELDTTSKAISSRGDFFKLKVESSHPDIIDGTVSEGIALLGSYEFEVRGVAKSEKELAYGFPDKDQTPVGFGFMEVHRADKEPLEIVIEPDATLQDVANQINDQDAGLRAMVINTKFKPDSYRLLVVSADSGEEAKIVVDEDTTFLEFKEQVTGRNLDILFEDVPITDEDNTLDELLDGVVFNVKRAEAGTRVQVNVTHDMDATVEQIKAFVDKYNEIANYAHQQNQEDPEGKRGILAGDGALRTIMRNLQSTVLTTRNFGGKYNIMADVGITTDPKTGNLTMDDSKVRAALAENYEEVASMFVSTKDGPGLAARVSDAIKGFRDPVSGVVKSRIKGLDTIIKNQDQDIERKQRQLTQKEEQIRRQFSSLESQMSKLNSQGDFLSARMGAASGQKGSQG